MKGKETLRKGKGKGILNMLSIRDAQDAQD